MVETANNVLGWVTDFVAEHPNHCQFTKEQAVRALLISIQGHKHRTAEEYKELTASRWAGVKAIVSHPGGFQAFEDAEGVLWTMTLVELDSNHVKASSLHLLPLFVLRPIYHF
jgi:hypothetical protein